MPPIALAAFLATSVTAVEASKGVLDRLAPNAFKIPVPPSTTAPAE